MEASVQPSAHHQAEWTKLPDDLLIAVFQILKQRDLFQAELVCKSWHSVLENPAPDLWGNVEIKLDKLQAALQCSCESPGASITKRVLSTCRWLQARRKGISSLHLSTEECPKRSFKHLSRHRLESTWYHDVLCRLLSVVSSPWGHAAEGLLAMLASSVLHQQPNQLDLHVKIQSRHEMWPVNRSPMLQQALAKHLVTLHLEQPDYIDEWHSICRLTALTSLRLPIPLTQPAGHIQLGITTGGAATEHDQHPIAALTALQKLRRLELMGSQVSVQQVNLSALTWLSYMNLDFLGESLALASTMPTALRLQKV
ncbi:hypothetical protein WJX73_009630 [Symbiochloris irregularis]|uniref:F-box domain-containing protein n=1 Tax=Symbiochloris irregularis TaxID=706552 RepID=A0AAW1NWU4_9CHLO